MNFDQLFKGNQATGEIIRKKLKAAAYDSGTVNWRKLFRNYDKQNTGEINFEGFRSVVRKEAKIGDDIIKDDQLLVLFKQVDKDGGGTVDYESEFVPWLDPLSKEVSLKDKRKKNALRGKWDDRNQFILDTQGDNRTKADVKQEAALREEKIRQQKTLKMVRFIKRKLKVAAYFKGKMNWKRLFMQYDRDNSGEINFDEFRMAIRKDAKITPEMLSENKLRTLFNYVDEDHSGTINYKTEFVPWVEQEDVLTEDEKRDQERMLSKANKVDEINLLTNANQAYVRARVCLPFLIRWMNHILVLTGGVNPDRKEMTMENFMAEMRDGIHLLQLVRSLCSNAHFGVGLYSKCFSRPMCESNLEKALAAACRHSVNMGDMCSPSDFYEGHVMQIARCLKAIFDALQMRPIKKKVKQMLKEMDDILRPLGRPLLDNTLSDPFNNGHYVVTDFADGTRLMILLVLSDQVKLEELQKLRGNPVNDDQLLENEQIIRQALLEAHLPVIIEARDWIIPPAWNFDCIFYQLHALWAYLRPTFQKGKATQHDLSDVRFSDGIALRQGEAEHRNNKDRAMKARRAAVKADISELGQCAHLARNFAVFIFRLGGLDVFWEKIEDVATGPPEARVVDEKGFMTALIKLDSRHNYRRLFNAADEHAKGVISKDQLAKFMKMSQAGVLLDLGDKLRAPHGTQLYIDGLNYYKEGDIGMIMEMKTINGEEIMEILWQRTGLSSREKQDQWFEKFQFAEKAQAKPEKKRALGYMPAGMLGNRDRDTIASNDILEFAALVQSLGGVDKAFDQFNSNQRGGLTKHEFHEAAKRLGLRCDIEKVYSQLDLDRSGWVGKTEMEDLISAFNLAGCETDGMFIELLVDFPDKSAEWLDRSIPQFLLDEEKSEARLPGMAEERQALFSEDLQRQDDMILTRAQSIAEKVISAAKDALRAVDAYQPKDDDLMDISECVTSVGELAPAAQGPAPTSCIDIRLVLADAFEQSMWLQTAVVDRTGTGSQNMEDSAFVLEVRDQRGVNSLVHAQLDVSMIQSIEQVGPPIDLSDNSAPGDAFFIVSAHPDADLGGTASEMGVGLRRIFQKGEGGSLQLYIIAGPSLRKRQEAVIFFDELRIMVHFLSAGGSRSVHASSSPQKTSRSPGPGGKLRASLAVADSSRISPGLGQSRSPSAGLGQRRSVIMEEAEDDDF